jgi:hypothetical protein
MTPYEVLRIWETECRSLGIEEQVDFLNSPHMAEVFTYAS